MYKSGRSWIKLVQRVKTERSFWMKALKRTVYHWTFTCEYALKCIRWYILFQPIHFQFSFSYFSVSKTESFVSVNVYFSNSFFYVDKSELFSLRQDYCSRLFSKIRFFLNFHSSKDLENSLTFSWKLVMFNSQPLFVFWIIDYWLNFDSFGDRAAGNRWTEHWDDDD